MLVEAVQGEGGCVPASAEWLRGLRDITARHDVPLVIDEVQTGIGRTGDMFAHEWARIVPDAIVMSKAIGGGFPLSLLAYHRKYDVWTPGAHAGTFRGNQIALVSGAATMKYILEERVLENVSKVGSALMEHFQALKGRYPCIGEVRGRGLMLGVELVDPLGRQDMIGHYPANGELARALKKNCLRHGLIVETGGRYGAVMRFLPPLIINRNDAVEIASRFEAALSEAWMNDRPAPLQPARRPSIERVE
jgi:diaminobutyrate-2-oxoglutarate transaminase